MTRAQAAPRLFQRASTRQNEQNVRESGPSGLHQPVAPPTSSRFKPAPIQGPTANAVARQPAIMGPPPTPQHVRNGNGRSVSSNIREQVNTLTSHERINDPSQLSAGHHQTHDGTSGLSTPAQQTSSTTSRRFFPNSGSNPAALSSHGSSNSNSMRGPSRTIASTPSSSNQRFQFLPEAAQRGNFG